MTSLGRSLVVRAKAIAELREMVGNVASSERETVRRRRALGVRARQVQTTHNMSLRGLAEEIGVSHVTLRDWMQKGDRDG